MAKSGLLPAKPSQPSSAAADAWVSGSAAGTDPAPKAVGEPTKRMTFDLPESLHRRVMLDCATNGVKMTTVIRQMLEERWPASEAR